MISVPWYFSVDLNSVHVMTSWTLLYFLSSIPFGVAIRSVGKIILLKKKLKKLEAEDFS